MKELSSYRFHIDIDGHGPSYGLFLKLLSGGLVLKVQSPDRCVQWYYDRLVPEVNFVPVREDLSDRSRSSRITASLRSRPRRSRGAVANSRSL